MIKHIYTITKNDINKTKIIIGCKECQQIKYDIDIFNIMGRIINIDIGKRIYEVSKGIYQVENQQQLQRRINNHVRLYHNRNI